MVSHWNHTELACINRLAQTAGCAPPFDHVEPLVNDTGEVFFSEHLGWLKKEQPKSDDNDICLCMKCDEKGATHVPKQQPTQTATLPATNHANNMSNVPAAQQVTPMQQRQNQPQQLILPILWFPPMPALCSMPAFCCEICKNCCLQTNKRGHPPHSKQRTSRIKGTK